MKEKWIITNKKESFLKLSNSIQENSLLLRLLANRGIDDEKLAKMFLYGDINSMHNGYLMKDMDIAIEILKEAIDNNKKIVIYGDYDCDGVISTTILYKTLKRLGANFGYHIPHREDEGYGLNSARMEKLYKEGYEIVLTCDNGISGFDEVNFAKNLGMKIIVTDHHDIPKIIGEDGVITERFPEADAVVNPKRKDCIYPFKNLCGAGIALKLATCLFNEYGIDKNELLELLEIAAIATVCDVVDLIDENRIIVKEGLKLLNKTKNIGLKELFKVTEIENKKIEEYHLGFIIGPCINATGRLETASLSVDLLIENNVNRAKELACTLHELNVRRQELTKESAERIIDEVEKNYKNNKVIVVYDEEIHESIAGIVAGRVKEKFYRPTIILTKGKEMPKGSARSIEGYNITEELTKCKELIEKFGGHPMAAGLSIKEENIKHLREKINRICKLTESDLLPVVRIDSELKVNYLDFDILSVIEKMKPYGKANVSPVFAVRNLELDRIWILGKEKNVLKLRFKYNSNGNTLFVDGISFDQLLYFKECYIEAFSEYEYKKAIDTSYIKGKIDIIYYPSINEFNGNKSIQLIIKNIRISN